MSRTVAALYDSRSEAELARARLLRELRAKSSRIIGRDTAAALEGLDISPNDADYYRHGLRTGGHLLIAEVPRGASATRIIELLEDAAGGRVEDMADQGSPAPQQSFRVESAPEDEQPQQSVQQGAQAPDSKQAPDATRQASKFAQVNERLAPVGEPEMPDHASSEEIGSLMPQNEVRIGTPEVARSGARVRAFTHEAVAEEQVSLKDELVEVVSRPSDRRVTDGDIEAGGLLKERVFEIAETREEPVVSKVAVVREEVIVTKTVKERTETVRDTVRRTSVEVEDLPEDQAAAFFR